jgi:hypothetical protein
MGEVAMITITFDTEDELRYLDRQQRTNEDHDRQRDSDAQREANQPRRRGGIIALVVVMLVVVLVIG